MYVEQFLNYIKCEKKYSIHTLVAYQKDIEQFDAFCADTLKKNDLLLVESADVRQWIAFLMESNVEVSSIKRKISALNSLCIFLLRNKRIKKNPVDLVVLPKQKKKIPSFFKVSEVNSVIEEMSKDQTFVGIRDRLVLDFFFQTGARVSELVNLKSASIDKYQKVVLLFGKGRKFRRVPIEEDLMRKICYYENVRNAKVGRTEYFFVRETGNRLYVKLVYNLVREKMSIVCSAYKRSPHVLRHTFATTLLNNGADIYAIKELLGHKSLAATEVYTHVMFDKLMKTYKNAHPRA